MTERIRAYKCTRSDGTDFYTGTVNYRAHLLSGEPIVHPNPDPPQRARTGDTCGKGFHVSPTLLLATSFGNRDHRPFTWFEVEYLASDCIEADAKKARLSCVRRVVRELSITDVFGADFYERIAAVRADIATWKDIPWLKPTAFVSDVKIEQHFRDWHAALSPFVRPGAKLCDQLLIVRTASAASAASAAIAVSDAIAVSAVSAASAASAVSAAIDAIAASDASDAIAASAAIDAIDAIDASAASAASAASGRLSWRWHWHLRPYYSLRILAHWNISGLPGTCPVAPLLSLYRLGCLPLGISQGKMVIYAPDPIEPTKEMI